MASTKERLHNPQRASVVATRLVFFFLLVPILFPSLSRAQDAPIFEITPVESTMKFDVKASAAIAGKFDKWDATLTFTSPELSTAVLDIKIRAASVDTDSGMKNGKLKGKRFFDAENNPLITFHSTKVIQTGPDTLAAFRSSRLPIMSK
jgi:polyisoprenoid-binding protein YceI